MLGCCAGFVGHCTIKTMIAKGNHNNGVARKGKRDPNRGTGTKSHCTGLIIESNCCLYHWIHWITCCLVPVHTFIELRAWNKLSLPGRGMWNNETRWEMKIDLRFLFSSVFCFVCYCLKRLANYFTAVHSRCRMQTDMWYFNTTHTGLTKRLTLPVLKLGISLACLRWYEHTQACNLITACSYKEDKSRINH